MKSKVEILGEMDNWTVNGVPFNVSTMDALKAMDEYAKQEAISFKEWQDENLEGKLLEQYSGHNEWYNGHTKQVISTEQLYNIYLTQKKQQ